MRKGVNKVIVVGNVGNDPESSATKSGSVLTKLSIATSESWDDKNTGQKQERTEWHKIMFTGGLAKVVQDYVKKGSKLYVEGKLQTSKWTDKQGVERYTTQVVASEMQMLDSKPQGSARSGQQNAYSASSAAPTAESHFDDESIPF